MKKLKNWVSEELNPTPAAKKVTTGTLRDLQQELHEAVRDYLLSKKRLHEVRRKLQAIAELEVLA